MTHKIQVPPLKVVFEKKDRELILSGIDSVLSSGMLASGKNVEEFERFWADYTGCSHAVACSNGGAALELILKSLDISGKDVLVPTNTFIATVNAVIFSGGNPVLLDTDPETMGVSLGEIKRKRTADTAGVIVVHIGGIIAPDTDAIAAWCKEEGLWLVEDAAHAHGSELRGRRAGSFGIAAAYSFFATKVVTSGEGGMVATNDDSIARKCRSFRDYGKKSQWVSEHEMLGGNFRISEITAVIGLAHSRRLDEFIEWRSKTAGLYTERLGDVLRLVLPRDRSSWYKYIAVLPGGIERAEFKARLREKGVSLSGGVYDLPMHRQPVFEGRYDATAFPDADSMCSNHICLPLFYGMTDEQTAHTVDSVRSVLKEMTKG